MGAWAGLIERHVLNISCEVLHGYCGYPEGCEGTAFWRGNGGNGSGMDWDRLG